MAAITSYKPDVTQTVADRIRAFLELHAGKTFSPKELMEAIGGGEDSVRKALTHLVMDQVLIKTGYATYKVVLDPHNGPSDWDMAKAMRNWEDP